MFSISFPELLVPVSSITPIVGKHWHSQIQGTRMFILSQKLKITKHHLKEWLRNFLGNNHQKLILNSQKMETVEQKLSNQPQNYHLNSWLNRLLMQRKILILFHQK